MNILVTGASGFIGRNLVAELGNSGFDNIYRITRNTTEEELALYTKQADFVFHLAGVNRPQNAQEFMEGNYGFTDQLLQLLKEAGNNCPIVITSSIQAELENPYGASKKAAEAAVLEHCQHIQAKAYIYQLPNVFGKWSRPNYNSVVATFCHNISRGLDITINDENVELKLVYIDDVVQAFVGLLENNQQAGYCEVAPVHNIKLGEMAKLLYAFKESRQSLMVPNLADPFVKALYSTYLSFLPEDQFSYPLKMHVDYRGSFTEILKTSERGQVSVNISKPGITKGNHWHHTKNEKFLVVSGTGVIRFRKIDSEDVIEYFVSGEKLEVVDIPVGYTHNIENLGQVDMVTIMWVNEIFDPEKPDTIYLEV